MKNITMVVPVASFPPPMLFNLLVYLVISMLLGGCAAEGVVVEKRSRPRPDSSMIGTEGVHSFIFRGPTGTSRPPITVRDPQFWAETSGSYKFILRDRQGNVRSQLVTPEVFARYRVGDYFNDLLPPPNPRETKDAKDSATKPAVHRRSSSHYPHQTGQAHRTPRKVARQHRHQRQRAFARHTANIVPPG